MLQVFGDPPGSCGLETPHNGEVVGRHGNHCRIIKAVGVSQLRDLIQMADAPFRIFATEALVKRHVPIAGLFAAFMERPVQDETTARVQNLGRAAHEPLGRRPRRNMDHVDAEDGVGAQLWERRAGVELHRRCDIRQSVVANPSIDAPAGGSIGITRLKREIRMRGRQVDDVFAAAACDLQDVSAFGQDLTQNIADGVAIASSCRCKPSRIVMVFGQTLNS